MTPSAETAALVALLRQTRRSWTSCAQLVEAAGSAIAVLEQEMGANPSQPRLFTDDGALTEAAADIADWESQGMQLLTIIDPDYPENLRAVTDSPPLLFVKRRLEPRDTRSVAVVGARAAGPQAIANATHIAAHLATSGYTIISGLAAGIDTAAHTAALASGGRTVAVIGTGLKRCYPPENAPLQRRIATEGAVVSQFWPDAPPTRRSFPMRNAVLSGLATATVVVDASDKGGSRIQAGLARAQGRPLFLHESLLAHQWARDFAAHASTHVIRSPSEITATLGQAEPARA